MQTAYAARITGFLYTIINIYYRKLLSCLKFLTYLCTRFKNKLYEQLLQYP